MPRFLPWTIWTLAALLAVGASAFEGRKETWIRQGDSEVLITIDDAIQIRSALLDALRQSKLSDRDDLIALTEPLPAWIDSDGHVMVGGWLLQLRNRRLIASYRLSQNEERAIGYAASVIRDGKAWRVPGIVPETVLFRRSSRPRVFNHVAQEIRSH